VDVSTTGTQIIDSMNNHLEAIFLKRQAPQICLNRPETIASFLVASKLARDCGNRDLEQTLLLIGKERDEKPDSDPNDALGGYFHDLVEYVRLFDETLQLFSRLAIMESISIDAGAVMRLHACRERFNELEPSLFHKLFLADLMGSRFTGSYGRRKVKTLLEGLQHISDGTANAVTVVERLIILEKEQRLLMFMLDCLRDNISKNYSRFASSNDMGVLKRLLLIDLRQKGMPVDDVPDELFRKGMDIIKKEALYRNNLLPMILRSGNRALREEFITESGLDLFFIEELEHEYCNTHQLAKEQLAVIRQPI